MTRETKDKPFVPPTRRLDDLNTPFEDWVYGNCLSLDGHEIYFVSTRPGSEDQDVWMVQFNVPGNPGQGFHSIENLGPGVNAVGDQADPIISENGLRLYYRNDGDLYVATRTKKGQPFENSVLVSSKLGDAWFSAISSDELSLFWTASSPGMYDGRDIWISTRESIRDALGRQVVFDNPVNLGAPINTDSNDQVPCLTADWPRPDSHLYFSRDGMRVLRATWRPRPEGASERGADVRASRAPTESE